MSKADFTKTSSQVEKEIAGLIDIVDRSLDSSNNDSERKGQLIISAFVSLVVFASILGFEYFVSSKAPQVSQAVHSNDGALTATSASFLSNQLRRIDAQATEIISVRNRVAPAMPIDGYVDSIRNSTQDIRGVLALPSNAVDAGTQSASTSQR